MTRSDFIARLIIGQLAPFNVDSWQRADHDIEVHRVATEVAERLAQRDPTLFDGEPTYRPSAMPRPRPGRGAL
jgi:hypothetical protein